MSRRRLIVTGAIAFLVSQVFEVAIHGFILDADYSPYRGTLLRAMDEGVWQSLLLPVAHLSFVIAFVWICSRIARPGNRLGQGLRFGFVAWLLAQVPLWLLWYAEQPWPGDLVLKQLGLELVAALGLGIVVAALLCREPEARAGLVGTGTR